MYFQKSMKRLLFKWEKRTQELSVKKNVKSHSQHSLKQTPIELYDANNINQLHWPNHPYSLFIKQLFLPLIENGSGHYIDNLKTEIKLLKIDDLVLPLMINDQEYNNSYICSPYQFYISYALESMNIIKNRVLKQTITGVLRLFSTILKQGQVNRVIHVNNLPFSANVFPPLEETQLAAIIEYLTQKFPQHALLFRAINEQSNSQECHGLKNIGASFIAYRQIYMIDPTNPDLFHTKTFKKDLKQLQKTEYEIINADQLKEEDFSRIAQMYTDLYIHHHSTLNPQFNQSLIESLVKNRTLQFTALRKDDRIYGMFGYFHYNGLMLSPFVAYDRTVAQSFSIYETLSTLLILEAKKHQVLLNMGAGASTFKKNRKAQGYLEYNTVYYQHLSLKRRSIWILLKSLINSIGIHYMKKY